MSHQVCTFMVDGLHLGLPVAEVQEVLCRQALTPVPRAHPVIRGLLYLRGQIIAAVDLRRRLGVPERLDEEFMTVVVRTPEGATALLVDEIGDVADVERELEPPPDNLPLAVRELAVGVHELERGLLLMLSAERAASVPS